MTIGYQKVRLAKLVDQQVNARENKVLDAGGFGSADEVESLVALALEGFEPVCDAKHAVAA
jgi:hypothetical protein